jgi:hypothetical protein
MADYSEVRDQNDVVRGIWLKEPAEAKDIYLLSMLAARIADEGSNIPGEFIKAILAKQYRIVPNTYNAVGGCFVMFGDALAPGEKGSTS